MKPDTGCIKVATKQFEERCNKLLFFFKRIERAFYSNRSNICHTVTNLGYLICSLPPYLHPLLYSNILEGNDVDY